MVRAACQREATIFGKLFRRVCSEPAARGIDLHAKGIDQPTIEAVLETGLPVTISPKFWAEHLGLPTTRRRFARRNWPIRAAAAGRLCKAEEPQLSPVWLRRPAPGGRRYEIVHRVWPGTSGTALGDPVFAAAYSRAFSFCGSQGCEIFDRSPSKDAKARDCRRPRWLCRPVLAAGRGDFAKYAFTYRIWGRLLFNPAAHRRSGSASCATSTARPPNPRSGRWAMPAASAAFHHRSCPVGRQQQLLPRCM